jgi:hypothetical protein
MRPIRARAACIRRCYDDALARNPVTAGRVSVRFVVDEDGWVRSARVSDDETGDPVFAACVANQLVGLASPSLTEGPSRWSIPSPSRRSEKGFRPNLDRPRSNSRSRDRR